MHHESIRVRIGENFSKLLGGPIGGRMGGDVAMQDSPRVDLHRDKHIENLKRRRDRDEEIAGDDRLGVVFHECRPTLIARSWRRVIDVLADRSGGNATPSFSDNSLAIRSSPQVGLSRASWRISSFKFFGSDGRPRLRDFHCQNIRNADRCHLMNVSGLTITGASRHSKRRPNATIVIRARVVIRRGLAFRSVKNASCLRRKKILGDQRRT